MNVDVDTDERLWFCISQYNCIIVWNQKGWGESSYVYPATKELESLFCSWLDINVSQDQIESGVLADWLEENADLLLCGATGPSDPAIRLSELIQYLRSRLVGV